MQLLLISYTMRYDRASVIAEKIKKTFGCGEVFSTPLIMASTKYPLPEVKSTIYCKIKLMKGMDGTCTALGGGECPLGFSNEELKEVGKA